LSLSPGARLGPYEIVAPLGAGGMGEVYRARDTRLGREVAIKVLPEEVGHDADRLRRFEQEARAASALQHPNLLVVFDVGREGGATYLVTELLAGEPLRDLLRRGRLAPKRALEFAAQVARGLAAAHERGIVHRDLKPENLFLTRAGTAKILDFGLARLATAPASASALGRAPTVEALTGEGAVLGTVGYMSPERARGEPADARSDLFSLGVVVHELLSGTNPFRRDSAIESLHALLREEPPALGGGVPPELARLVGACSKRSPSVASAPRTISPSRSRGSPAPRAASESRRAPRPRARRRRPGPPRRSRSLSPSRARRTGSAAARRSRRPRPRSASSYRRPRGDGSSPTRWSRCRSRSRRTDGGWRSSHRTG
jgi:serine/threonine protein kinase